MKYNRIKAVLADKGVTSKQLYEALNVGQEAVSFWCTNKTQPSIKRLYEIAEFLDVDVRELLVPNKAK